MNILLGFLVYLPAALAGILLVHWLWRGSAPALLLAKIGLGIGLGLGLTSLLYFLSLLLFNNQSGYLAIQLALFGFALTVSWLNRRDNPILPIQITFNRLQKILLAAFGVLLLVTLASYFVNALMNPHGGFDAWMIYNRTARFFYRGGTDWLRAFSQDIYWQFHADYPLLIPLNVSGAWNTLGGEIMRAPQAHGAYMYIGILCLLMGAVARVRTKGQSLLAGLVLLGTPAFIYEAPREAADLTLSFFMLGTTIMFFLYQREEKNILLSLAGFSCGLAAWTKNEGLLFLLAASAVCALLAYRRRSPKVIVNFAIGLAFPLVNALYFKLFLAPSNDLFANANRTTLLGLLADTERYKLIFAEFVDHIVWFGRAHLSILALLVIYILIVKLDARQQDKNARLIGGLLLAIQFIGYFAIYLVTPHDLDWHLRTSLGRLIMHLYPAALFLFFASLSDPETVFAK